MDNGDVSGAFVRKAWLKQVNIVGFQLTTKGVFAPLVAVEPSEDENAKAVADIPTGPYWFWHSGMGAVCLPGPQGFIGFKARDLKEAGWRIDEVELARLLPRVPGSGLASGAGGDVKAEAEAAKRRALIDRGLKGRR
jgi:hypothetical protein